MIGSDSNFLVRQVASLVVSADLDFAAPHSHFYPATAVSAINHRPPFHCGASCHNLVAMKRAEVKKYPQDSSRACANSALAELDPALLNFVEALAIADARRDHLALSGPALKHNLDAAAVQAGSSNDARSDLCPVFDRTSERKVD